MLMWDYLLNKWAEWSQTGGRDLAIWRGTPMLADTLVKKEQASYGLVDYDVDVELQVKFDGLQGFACCRGVLVLGEFVQERCGHCAGRQDLVHLCGGEDPPALHGQTGTDHPCQASCLPSDLPISSISNGQSNSHDNSPPSFH
jgi:hypothetical protein